MSVCLCLCLSVSVCLCLCLFLSPDYMHVTAFPYLSVCLSVCTFCLSVCMSQCLFLSFCLSLSLSVCLSLCLSLLSLLSLSSLSLSLTHSLTPTKRVLCRRSAHRHAYYLSSLISSVSAAKFGFILFLEPTPAPTGVQHKQSYCFSQPANRHGPRVCAITPPGDEREISVKQSWSSGSDCSGAVF